MSRTNETRHIKWHESCKCECRLDASVNPLYLIINKVDGCIEEKNQSKYLTLVSTDKT